MKFFSSIPRVRLVEGINLGIRRHLLTVGEIVSGRQLSPLELNYLTFTSSNANPCPNSKSRYSPLWLGYTNF
jgi:hypothetical protein